MSTWDAPKRTLTIWRGAGVLASLFGVIAMANAAVLWAPLQVGDPYGGGFLPVFATMSWLGAALAGPVVLARRLRIGLGACAAFCAALATLGAIDAYLWML